MDALVMTSPYASPDRKESILLAVLSAEQQKSMFIYSLGPAVRAAERGRKASQEFDLKKKKKASQECA